MIVIPNMHRVSYIR